MLSALKLISTPVKMISTPVQDTFSHWGRSSSSASLHCALESSMKLWKRPSSGRRTLFPASSGSSSMAYVYSKLDAALDYSWSLPLDEQTSSSGSNGSCTPSPQQSTSSSSSSGACSSSGSSSFLQSLPTPLQEEIQSRPQLRKTKKSLPTPLRFAIEIGHVLCKTKPTLPTPLRDAIKQCPALQATKHKMATPLKEETQRGVKLHPVQPQPAPSVRSKRVYTDTITACETPVLAPPAKRRKVSCTPLPYNFSQSDNTPDVIPIRRSKRDYEKTVTAFETPVALPPAKKMKTAGSPALSTPLPYNFEQFIQPSKNSPVVDLTGLQRLFHSPRVCNSCDPADVFEVRLFGESREVSFASPLTVSAKKSSRPNSAQALHSCMKQTTAPLFTMGRAEPQHQQKRSRTRRNLRAASVTTVCTRVTRSQARAEVPSSEAASGNIAVNESGKENIPSPPKRVLRSTRSHPVNFKLPPPSLTASRKHTRSTKTDTVPTNTVSTCSNTRTLNQQSKPDDQTAQPVHTRLTRQQAKLQATQGATRAKISEPAAAVTETSKRSLRRQGGRKTRQRAKQEAVEVTAKPFTRSSRGKKGDTSPVPLRRSSRLKK